MGDGRMKSEQEVRDKLDYYTHQSIVNGGVDYSEKLEILRWVLGK